LCAFIAHLHRQPSLLLPNPSIANSKVTVVTLAHTCHNSFTSQNLGFGVFAKIFSKNIVIPSKEIPFFGEAHQRFWAITAKFGFFCV
jgi:hypothetical protein